MNAIQQQMLDELRRKLEERSWLADDRSAYRAGVEDTIDEIVTVLEEEEALVPLAR